MISLDDIQVAAERIADGIYDTPCPESAQLSLATGCRVYCKLDNLQRTGSFKERGARNALLKLSAQQKQHGVITASAGNHALGLAYHARTLKIPVTVVMPETAPLTKVANCQRLGAEVVQHGSSLDQARVYADHLAQNQKLTYINGYDHPDVIAGQGTMALEILQHVPQVDAVIVPIGGAGLIAGMALAIKSLRPEVLVLGVEPARAASFTAAQKAGTPVPVSVGPTLADGLAVSQVGALAFEIARSRVDRVVTVSERAIARAILRLMELEKSVVEGAGAVPLAALLSGLFPELEDRTVVLPLCGGNIDMTLLGRIIERGLAAEDRLCRFDAAIADRPGGLARFTAIIADEGASIIDIAHDRAFSGEDLSNVLVHCVVETRDRDHIHRLRDRLIDEGFEVRFRE